MPRKLKDIDVDEMSFVESGANRKKFAIRKERTVNEKLKNHLESFLGEDALTEDAIAKAAEISDERAEELVGALDTVESFRTAYPPDLLEAVNVVLKSICDYPTVEGDGELSDEDFLKELTEKAGARLNKVTVADLRKIKDIVDKILGDRDKQFKRDMGDGFDKLPESVQAQLIEAQEIKAEKQKADEQKKNDDQLKAVAKTVEDTMKKLLKEKPLKKGLKSDEKDDDDDDKKDDDKTGKYPSLMS